MVKKIQIVDQEDPITEEMDTADFQTKILELLSAIDWKLWELYKIEQERSKREQQVASAGMKSAEAEVEASLEELPKAKRKPKPETEATGLEYKPVRVEE